MCPLTNSVIRLAENRVASHLQKMKEGLEEASKEDQVLVREDSRSADQAEEMDQEITEEIKEPVEATVATMMILAEVVVAGVDEELEVRVIQVVQETQAAQVARGIPTETIEEVLEARYRIGWPNAWNR